MIAGCVRTRGSSTTRPGGPGSRGTSCWSFWVTGGWPGGRQQRLTAAGIAATTISGPRQLGPSITRLGGPPYLLRAASSRPGSGGDVGGEGVRDDEVEVGPSEVVLQLARSYHRVQNPALANMRYSQAVQDFTEQAVLAYECGHNEADVAEQLGRLPGEELRVLQGFDRVECLSLVTLVWITLSISPQSVKRWAMADPVSEPTLASWRGFVAMIVNGYFERRMAWFPLDRLQLELAAVQGRSLPQDVVAEHARIVYTTLEKVYPQFAKD